MVNRRLWNTNSVSNIGNSILPALYAVLISVYLFLHRNVSVDGCLNKYWFKHRDLYESAKLNEELGVLQSLLLFTPANRRHRQTNDSPGLCRETGLGYII